MKVKLNGPDYAFWVIFAAMALVLLYQTSVHAASILFYPDNLPVRATLMAVLMLLAALLISLGLIFGFPIIAAKNSPQLQIIHEAVAALIIGGFFLYHILSRPVDAASYALLDLTNTDQSGYYVGAASLYASLVNFAHSASNNPTLFLYYGIYIMQCLGVLLIFFALRFLSGALCAYLAAIIMAASSYYMDKATYGGPEVVYMLLWSLSFFTMSLWCYFAKAAAAREAKEQLGLHGMLVSAFLAGMSVHVDLSGVLLLAAGVYIIYLNKPRLKLALVFSSGVLGGFFIMLFREAVIRSNIISENIQIWLSRQDLNIAWRIYVPDENVIILALLVVFALILVFFYPRIGGKSLLLYSFFVFMLTFIYPSSALPSVNLNMWRIMAWAAAAGLGLDAVCRFAQRDSAAVAADVPLPVPVPVETMPVEMTLAETTPVEAMPVEIALAETTSAETTSVETTSVEMAPADRTPLPVPMPAEVAAEKTSDQQRYDSSQGVEYLKNPLPLPPKRPRRMIDYPYEVPPELMHYDIEVAPDADYDIGARPSRRSLAKQTKAQLA